MDMKIPKIDTLMQSLSEPGEETQRPKEEPSAAKAEDNEAETASQMTHEASGSLWPELLSMLESSQADAASVPQKIYKIDSDIVETVAQCDFKGRSVCSVINCMLRTFLIANIGSLDKLRRRSPSLFDTYLKNDRRHEGD